MDRARRAGRKSWHLHCVADPGNTAPVPVDLVTASGSGLDSPAAALYQASRVAKAPGLAPDVVARLVEQHAQGPFLGVLGEPGVNVLALKPRPRPTGEGVVVKKIEALIRPFKLEEVKQALTGAGVDALTITEVLGRGRNESRTDTYRGLAYTIDLTPKIGLEVVVPDCRADHVVSLITGAARTGGSEAGTIVVSPVEDAIRIRTGEHGEGVVW